MGHKALRAIFKMRNNTAKKSAERQDVDENSSLFSPALLKTIIVLFFVISFVIRLRGIGEPPLDFHCIRQLHSALIARALYFKSNNSIPDWRKNIAVKNCEIANIVEPRINENLAAFGYKILGKETLVLPKILSVIYWLIGGFFVYLLVKEISSPEGAIASLGFYLFLPYGIIASRSFQPDPLMIMLISASVYYIWKYFKQPSTKNIVIAAIVSGLAFFAKIQCVFLIYGAFISLLIFYKRSKVFLLDKDFWIFAFVSAVLAAGYYGKAVYEGAFLKGVLSNSFMPYYWFNTFFWHGYARTFSRVMNLVFVGLSFIGILLCRNKMSKILCLGLFAGYTAFALLFTYHSMTHDYYHLQAVPIVAICLGPLASAVLKKLFEEMAVFGRRIIIALMALFVFLAIFDTWPLLSNPEYESIVESSRTIGELVKHSDKIMTLSNNSGYVLKYYGEVVSVPWRSLGDMRALRMQGKRIPLLSEYFESMQKQYEPEYFVVTDFGEFYGQEGLPQFMSANFALFKQTDDYVIFDLRKPSNLKGNVLR